MSGFQLPEKRAVITLDDGDYAGAEIVARLRIPFGVLRELMLVLQAPDDEGLARLGDLFCEWGLVSWNLIDHRGAIPPTREGWDRLDIATMIGIVTAWIRGVVKPADPLPPTSSAIAHSSDNSRSAGGQSRVRSRRPSRSPS